MNHAKKPKQLELFKKSEIIEVTPKEFKKAKKRAEEDLARLNRMEIRVKYKRSNTGVRYVSGRYVIEGTIENRAYQGKIVAEYERFRNIAIIADTGKGKTVIAAMIINKFFEREGLGKKVLFLVPEVVLAHQQKDREISKMLRLSTVVVTGEVAQSERNRLYKNADIVFATPQTIVNDMSKGILSMDNIGLVIFDEAHHGIGKYAYVRIANICSEHEIERVPMSASLAPNEKKLEEIIEGYNIKKICMVDRNSIDVVLHDHECREETRYAYLIEPFYSVREVLKQHVDNIVNFFEEHGLVSKDAVNKDYLSEAEIKDLKGRIEGMPSADERNCMRRFLYEYRVLKLLWEYIECEGKTPFFNLLNKIISGLKEGKRKSGLIERIRNVNVNYLKKCGYEPKFYKDKEEVIKAFKSLIKNNDFYRIEPKRWLASWRIYLANLALLEEDITKKIIILGKLISSIHESEYRFYKNCPFFFLFSEGETIKRLSQLAKSEIEHPKLNILIDELKYGKGSKDIVFVRFKEMARVIAKSVIERTGRKAEVFVGQEKGNTRKRQREVVDRFVRGDFEVLITTIYEGHNMLADNAYFYDHTSTPIIRIQRKGRVGRHKDGFFIKIKTMLPDGNVSIDQIRDNISTAREKHMEKITKEAHDRVLRRKLFQELPLFK